MFDVYSTCDDNAANLLLQLISCLLHLTIWDFTSDFNPDQLFLLLSWIACCTTPPLWVYPSLLSFTQLVLLSPVIAKGMRKTEVWKCCLDPCLVYCWIACLSFFHGLLARIGCHAVHLCACMHFDSILICPENCPPETNSTLLQGVRMSTHSDDIRSAI